MEDDEKALILYKKGIEAYRRGELQKASDLLMQVVEASEEDHRAWNALGVVLTKMGMHTDADVCFENALTLDPENEIYKRNREKNRIHVRRSITDIFSLLPFNQLPKNPLSPRYVLGIIGLFVLLILIISLPPLVVNTSPPAEISQTIAVTLEQTKDLILIKNMGGPGLDVLERFDITWNNQSLDALGLLPRFLGITAGSTLAIPLEELGGISDTNEINVRIHAIFRDHTSKEILTQTIHLPIEQTEPRSEPIISATSHDPRFGVGDVLLRRDDGAYVLVSAILSDNQYRVEELTRFNDGSFYVQPGMSRNVSMEEYENLTQKITSMQVPVDAQFRPGVQYRAYSRAAARGAVPLYVAGDLVSRSSGVTQDVLVILGYDPGTDEYATDQIYPYYTGEWGFRPDAHTEWISRDDLERSYPARLTRIALSQIGIGQDSSPPGTAPDYREGDIVAQDRSADAPLFLILAYDPKKGVYYTDRIRLSYDGGWVRDGQNVSHLRSTLEREYPYKVRSIDVSRVGFT